MEHPRTTIESDCGSVGEKNSENSSGSMASFRKDEVLVVRLNSNCSFQVPMELVKLREREMRQAAAMMGFLHWNGSSIYRRCRKTRSLNITLSGNFRPAILSTIQNYYMTGKLCIPKNSKGSEVLESLDFFQIIHPMEQIEFEDVHVYNCVMAWSRYLFHRTEITTWIKRNLIHRNISFQSTDLPEPASDLFDHDTETAQELREDFELFLTKTLPDFAKVRFTLKDKKHAVLSIDQRDELKVKVSSISKTHPVFVLPDQLVEPITFTLEDTTVASALTSPVFDAAETIDEHEARRREYLQNTILNADIEERMKELLKPEPQPDPWEWVTGLWACEFHKTMYTKLSDYKDQIEKTTEQLRKTAEEKLKAREAKNGEEGGGNNESKSEPAGSQELEQALKVQRKPSALVKNRIESLQKLDDRPRGTFETAQETASGASAPLPPLYSPPIVVDRPASPSPASSPKGVEDFPTETAPSTKKKTRKFPMFRRKKRARAI